jgi:hypothetical protein
MTLYALILTTVMSYGSMIDEISVIDTEMSYENCQAALASNKPIIVYQNSTIIMTSQLGCWTMNELERVEGQD